MCITFSLTHTHTGCGGRSISNTPPPSVLKVPLFCPWSVTSLYSLSPSFPSFYFLSSPENTEHGASTFFIAIINRKTCTFQMNVPISARLNTDINRKMIVVKLLLQHQQILRHDVDSASVLRISVLWTDSLMPDRPELTTQSSNTRCSLSAGFWRPTNSGLKLIGGNRFI